MLKDKARVACTRKGNGKHIMKEEMKVNTQSIGERLYELRTKVNMTQERLAEELQVSRQSVSKWELDKTLPDVEKLIQISELYNVSMDYLIKGTAEEEDISEDGEGISENRETQNQGIIPVYRYTTCLICAILSAILCIVAFVFAIQLFSTKVGDKENVESRHISVNRILEQYTKAEVVALTFDGEIYSEVAWLDIPGVREGDFIDCYYDGESDEISFEYYTKTLILPIITGIVFLIFFIVFIVEWKTIKPGKRKIGKEEKESEE